MLLPLLSGFANYCVISGSRGWGLDSERGVLGKAWRDPSPELSLGGVRNPSSTPSWPKCAAGMGSLGQHRQGCDEAPCVALRNA